ncbi:hypothetical protein PR048_033729 [Dryococelus australis]|uniref:Uncharacterized protein n=1 Tax=Dryococelus australis TaxID=614101 RepID=A0ABQ9G142_9NEOP|nr:hypothetical protein PR048_033729 [Dryococelus australis]
MKHFVCWTNSSKDSPTLLLFDNHERQSGNNCDLPSPLFPHHPLDVAVYKEFKSFYNAAVDTWIMQHPSNTLTVYPFDWHIFMDEEFLCNYVSEQEQGEQSLPTIALPSTEMIEVLANEATENHVVSEAEKKELGCHSSEQRVTPSKNVNVITYKSHELFKGYPKAGNRKRKLKPLKKQSITATSTPGKNKLMAKKKLGTTESTGEDSPMEVPYTDTDNDKEFLRDLREEIWPENFEDTECNPIIGNFVFVQYDIPGKKRN